MKKTYIEPEMEMVVLQHQSYLLNGSPAVTSLSDPTEGIILDPDGLDGSDILR